MKNLYIKIICGFRKDQQYTIAIEEAHKAYYLFLNPDERGIFSSGLALTGRQIQMIEPDYNATMGWNKDYILDADDWNEIERSKVDRLLRDAMFDSKNVAQSGMPGLMSSPRKKMIEDRDMKIKLSTPDDNTGNGVV